MPGPLSRGAQWVSWQRTDEMQLPFPWVAAGWQDTLPPERATEHTRHRDQHQPSRLDFIFAHSSKFFGATSSNKVDSRPEE